MCLFSQYCEFRKTNCTFGFVLHILYAGHRHLLHHTEIAGGMFGDAFPIRAYFTSVFWERVFFGLATPLVRMLRRFHDAEAQLLFLFVIAVIAKQIIYSYG